MKRPIRLVVLCLNDFPIGIYHTIEEAESAAWVHESKNFLMASKIRYYHTHWFDVGKEAGR